MRHSTLARAASAVVLLLALVGAAEAQWQLPTLQMKFDYVLSVTPTVADIKAKPDVQVNARLA